MPLRGVCLNPSGLIESPCIWRAKGQRSPNSYAAENAGKGHPETRWDKALS